MSISVIIPSYNRCASLIKALHSVYQQSLAADEVIVIDDGSTDDTALMVKQQFPQVHYHYQANAGVSAARNQGIALANSEWLAFLDSDDEWLVDKLAKQQQQLQQQPLKVCHTEEIWIRNGKRVNQMKKHAKIGGWIFQQCLPLCAMSPSSIMIHSSVFAEVGLFDESLPACEDYDLWLRISHRYQVSFISEPLINKYGGHDDQLSQKFWGMDRFRIQALDKILSTNELSTENQILATEMLVKKATIYQQGALKRGKDQEVAHYQQLMAKYTV